MTKKETIIKFMDQKDPKISIGDLEAQIFNLEGIRVVFRTKKDNMSYPYPFKRKGSRTMNVERFKRERIKKTIDSRWDFDIIGGKGNIVKDDDYHDLNHLRLSYKVKKDDDGYKPTGGKK